MSLQNILLRHNYISVPSGKSLVGEEAIATILMNLTYYGYALNMEAYAAVTKLGPIDLANWWSEVETQLKDITGAGRKIGDFVVYKNFPAEVLAKSDAEYWIPQILMYWGFPASYFAEPVVPRAKMSEQPRAKVLKLAGKNTGRDILNNYLSSAARWKDQELVDVVFLSETNPINFAKFAFKENLIKVAAFFMSKNKPLTISTATDVLRLAVGLSDGDVSLREKSKLRSFKKPERKFLLSALEGCENLTDDVARRPELWKRLLHNLHAGDYANKYPRVVKVVDDLYNDRLTTFNSNVEVLLQSKSPEVLKLLTSRPGDFKRRLVHTLDLFGDDAAKAFVSDAVLSKLTTHQIVSMRTYLETVNSRFQRTFPPKGNWSKLQIGEARWVQEKHVASITKALGNVLATRIPKVKLDAATSMIKLPSNDGEVSPYARGTVFPIPDEVDFIRTASYWKTDGHSAVWFDNGWNFFDADWKDLGSCCWTEVNFSNGAAVFSGDPVNSSPELKGKAAQMIDLYPNKLKKSGVRYAVWNILCFSRIAFSKAEDVFAALQWGTGAQTGMLFQPSRCQLAFPLKGDSMTKYLCVIDLESREMMYLDANLHGAVRTAEHNGKNLSKNLPAFMEYVRSLPSVHDLFRESEDKTSNIHVLYSDKDTELKDGAAYVFKPENKTNKYKSMDLNDLLA